MKRVLVLFLILITVPAWAFGFGKNKVQYREFEWEYIETQHFDIYLEKDASKELTEITIKIAENAYDNTKEVFGYSPPAANRIPLIVYNSSNDFQQTNITLDLVGDGTGGFTEIFKNRVVVPFTGSYKDFELLIRHEMTHAFMYQMLFWDLSNVLKGASLFNIPLWFHEGLAEYSSYEWTTNDDLYIRDLALNESILPMNYLYGYLAYRFGRSIFYFIADKYGRERITELVQKLRTSKSLNELFEKVLNIELTDFEEKWKQYIKEKYYPDITKYDLIDGYAEAFTDHMEDNSFFNIKPTISPNGQRIAYISNKNGYSSIWLVDAMNKHNRKVIIEGEQSGDFESFHLFDSGMSWSADNRYLAFVTKTSEGDNIFVYDVVEDEIIHEHNFGGRFDLIRSPVINPVDNTIAFVAYEKGYSDLYLCSFDGSGPIRLTNDLYDGQDPAWNKDGTKLVFSTDRFNKSRKNPGELFLDIDYDIAMLDIKSGEITQLTMLEGDEVNPLFHGSSIIFQSDNDGFYQIYSQDLQDNSLKKLTSFIGGSFSPSINENGDMMTFTYFSKLGYDVFLMENPLEKDVLAGDQVFMKEKDNNGSFPEKYPFSNFKYDLMADSYISYVDADKFEIAKTNMPDTTKVEDVITGQQDTVYSFVDYDEIDVDRLKKTYTTKFSSDYIGGVIGYETGKGFSGHTEFNVSDIMGDHRFRAVLGLKDQIQDTDINVSYYFLKHRLDYVLSLYHYNYYDYFAYRTNLTLETKYYEVHPRFYGADLGIIYPINKFNRFEMVLSNENLYAEYDSIYIDYLPNGRPYWAKDYWFTEEKHNYIASFNFVNDVVLWGLTGPVNGSRSYLSVRKTFYSADDYLGLIFDYRKYVPLSSRIQFAFRTAYNQVLGKNNIYYYFGGSESFRGYSYQQKRAKGVAWANFELRFPTIEHLKLFMPLPLEFGQINGVVFLDFQTYYGEYHDDGIANKYWRNFEFLRKKTDSLGRSNGFQLEDVEMCYGLGTRANLGMFILKLDWAWNSDLTYVSKARFNLSLNADF